MVDTLTGCCEERSPEAKAGIWLYWQQELRNDMATIVMVVIVVHLVIMLDVVSSHESKM